MKLHWQTHTYLLKFPFRIARSVRTQVESVCIELEHDGIVGRGEAVPSARYGESIESTIAFLQKLDLAEFPSPFYREDILDHADAMAEGNHAAKCAVDLALHDWMGKALGRPLHQIWGLNPARTAPCSYTIGIGTEEEIRHKLEEATDFPILKVKLGSEHDRKTMDTIRSLTDKKLYVDVNEGWKTRDLALERVRWLRDYGVLFVEQPMPAAQADDLRWLRDHSELPLMADESFIRLRNLPAVAQAFDGINIKLMKCTGLREAQRIIAAARALGMKVMLGCMIESSIAISAGAQLSPLVDYADLDGNVLISNDPFDGIRNTAGVLQLNDRPGLGLR
ncbi:MAG: dipeptide epimerase [Chthoniobacter sp.]